MIFKSSAESEKSVTATLKGSWLISPISLQSSGIDVFSSPEINIDRILEALCLGSLSSLMTKSSDGRDGYIITDSLIFLLFILN